MLGADLESHRNLDVSEVIAVITIVGGDLYSPALPDLPLLFGDRNFDCAFLIFVAEEFCFWLGVCAGKLRSRAETCWT